MSLEDINNNTCQITIDTTDYYIPCDRVKDLNYIDGYLVNVSSQSMTLYPRFKYDVSVYPRIQCSAMQVCTLRTSSNYGTQPVMSNYTLKSEYFKVLNFEPILLFILLIFLGVRLIWKN